MIRLVSSDHDGNEAREMDGTLYAADADSHDGLMLMPRKPDRPSAAPDRWVVAARRLAVVDLELSRHPPSHEFSHASRARGRSAAREMTPCHRA